MTQTEKLDALRAFIIAITPEEHAKRAEVANLDDQRRALEQENGHRRWEIDRTQSRLASALGVSAETLADGPLAVEQMRKAAQDRLASAAKLPAGQPRSGVDAARREHEGARADGRGLKQNVSASRRPSPNPKKWRANSKDNCRGSRSRRAKRKVQSARFARFRSTAHWLKGADSPTNSLTLTHVASVGQPGNRTSTRRSKDLRTCALPGPRRPRSSLWPNSVSTSRRKASRPSRRPAMPVRAHGIRHGVLLTTSSGCPS
jgi:hypothetical protein